MPNKNTVWLCYGLYMASVFFGGLTSLVAVIINYASKGKSNSDLINDHIKWQIGTFWKSLIAVILLVIITYLLHITIILAFISYLLWLIFFIWYLYRLIKGAIAFNDGKRV